MDSEDRLKSRKVTVHFICIIKFTLFVSINICYIIRIRIIFTIEKRMMRINVKFLPVQLVIGNEVRTKNKSQQSQGTSGEPTSSNPVSEATFLNHTRAKTFRFAEDDFHDHASLKRSCIGDLSTCYRRTRQMSPFENMKQFVFKNEQHLIHYKTLR